MKVTIRALNVTAYIFVLLWLASCAPEQSRAPFAFVEATLDAMQSAIQSGDVTCVDIVEGHLSRIETYDNALGMNALLSHLFFAIIITPSVAWLILDPAVA